MRFTKGLMLGTLITADGEKGKTVYEKNWYVK